MDGRVFDNVAHVVQGMAVAQRGQIDDERQQDCKSDRTERGEPAKMAIRRIGLFAQIRIAQVRTPKLGVALHSSA